MAQHSWVACRFTDAASWARTEALAVQRAPAGLNVFCSFVMLVDIRRATADTDVSVPMEAALFCGMTGAALVQEGKAKLVSNEAEQGTIHYGRLITFIPADAIGAVNVQKPGKPSSFRTLPVWTHHANTRSTHRSSWRRR